jgi:hypothetical protein
MDQPKSFRFKPVEIEIGPADAEGKRKKVTIQDLSYAKQKDFIAKLCRIITERNSLPTVIEALPKAIEKQMISNNMNTKDAIEYFLNQITEIYTELNTSQVFELLKLALGDDQVTKEDFDRLGASECLGLLTYLVQLRCEPLKNFNASLNNTLFQKTN